VWPSVQPSGQRLPVRRNTPTLGAGARAGPPSPWRPRSWQGNRIRPGLAGEHWLVLGAGLLGLGWARGQPSDAGCLMATATGTALMACTASRRDGLAGALDRLRTSALEPEARNRSGLRG